MDGDGVARSAASFAYAEGAAKQPGRLVPARSPDVADIDTGIQGMPDTHGRPRADTWERVQDDTAHATEAMQAAHTSCDLAGAAQLPLDYLDPNVTPDVLTPEWLRLRARQLLREFLSAVPRSESEATITFLRPDGTPRTLTRAQLSASIDRLRPRQRQIIRLAVEEHWSQERVSAYLHGVSVRTVQRDQADALDLLVQL